MASQSFDDLQLLYEPLGLFVRPIARLSVTITLPPLKQPGQSISNWDLMERIKKVVNPVQLSSIKVVKSSIESVCFEAEVSSRKILNKVIKALDGHSMKVMGFFEFLKVRASETKSYFPTRHDWDDFFLNAREMDELKPGERPDTIYLSNLPTNWFKDPDSSSIEIHIKNIFERFGTVRSVDVPFLDPYRRHMAPELSGIQVTAFSFGQAVLFECYLQFEEYSSFVNAMDFLRNTKLVKQMPDGKLFDALIKVDFDKSNHLSQKKINRRHDERQRLMDKEQLEKEKNKSQIPDSVTENKCSEKLKEGPNKPRKHHERPEKIGTERKREKRKAARNEEEKMFVEEMKLQSRRLLSVLLLRVQASKFEKSAVDEVARTESAVDEVFRKGLELELRETLLEDHEKRLRQRIESKLLKRGAI